ncbi:MAG: VCBS repeat-containing protein, partial [Candidatus Latescibacteria bacterium]|nr:VCBS repeat-containing protein [Candidatus Latescibacterota bacterium]
MAERFQFEHEFIESDGGYDGWGAVVVADFDGDGRPEFATGGKGGGFYHIYDYDVELKSWTCHVVTRDFSPNVGAAAVDLDGDGRLELVCGEWGERLMWLVPPESGLDNWVGHEVGTGLD